MSAYYNEFDSNAADWLEGLIADGLIAPGVVDRRSIVDVRPGDLAGFTQCHFFAGIGGWSLAARMAGWPDARAVWTGSCPCQPFSLAGKQKGFADERHLWPAFRDLIGQCRPAVVFGEQVASATAWLGLVRSDLETMEYAVGCMPVEAASAGADHLRDRYWFVGRNVAKSICADERGYTGDPRGETIARCGEAWPADGNPADGPRAGSSARDDLAYGDHAGSQGRDALRECADQRAPGADGVADAFGVWQPQPQGLERDVGRWAVHGSESGAMADNSSVRSGTGFRESNAEQYRHGAAGGCDFEFVIGADGKARRVKSGIRLLAHGIPNRVAKLRGFGNAIDPRPAAAFIGAYCDATLPG